MIILRIRRGVLALMVLSVLASCNNEMDVRAPYKDIPIAYCMLNPSDSIQNLRLEKSFLGEGNAYVMAQQTDSIYYPDAIVHLERWDNDKMMEQLVMTRVSLPGRDSGIFTRSPNYVFQTTAPIKRNSEYHLAISIPSTGAEISAVTHTVTDFKVTKPESYKKTLALWSYENYQSVEWISAPFTRIYHLKIRFHYLEVRNSDTVAMTSDWNIGSYISRTATGGEDMKSEILNRNFYKWLGNKLSKPGSDVFRLVDKKALDFVFTVGGEELFTYMEVYDDDSGLLIDKPIFTNIVNGIGLFSSRNQQSVLGKSLSTHSIDSVAYGFYTKDLRFADSNNDYYFR